MNTPVTTEFHPHVAVINGEIKTNSIVVAEHFGKQHKNVLQSIERLECSPEFHELNFQPMQIEVEIGNGAKRMSPAYEMTKDGFTFLAMGFTGKEAAKWKEAYINAFNAMAEQLHNPPSLPEPPARTDLPKGAFISKAFPGLVIKFPHEQPTVIMHFIRKKARESGRTENYWLKKLFDQFGHGYNAMPVDLLDDALLFIQNNGKAVARPIASQAGNLRPAPAPNTLTLDLDLPEGVKQLTLSLNANPSLGGRWVLWHTGDMLTVRPMARDEFITTSDKLASVIGDRMGGAVHYRDLSDIIVAAGNRIGNANPHKAQ